MSGENDQAGFVDGVLDGVVDGGVDGGVDGVDVDCKLCSMSYELLETSHLKVWPR